MHRTSLIKLLETFKSHTAQEEATKDLMLAFINQHTECFERTLAIGHITASAWLLNQNHSQALLMHHAKLNKWVQLGGHCDGETDVLAVAIKEAQEESGIQQITPVHHEIFDIDIHLIPETAKEKPHYHYDVRFLLQVMSNEAVVQNSESRELRWINKNVKDLPTQEESVTRMFHKWLELV